MGRHYRGFNRGVPADQTFEMTSASRLQAPYRAASYMLSAHDMPQLPPDEGCEVAFVGRSNSGKSSAINALTGQKSLARSSKTPGRTRQLVYFRLDDRRRLVDLPGYGYANVPQQMRIHWQGVIDSYLGVRKSLRGIVLLMDVRHPLSSFDRQMLAWCHRYQLPAHVVLTKADKLKRGPAQAALLQLRQELRPGVTSQLFSATRREGVEELARRIAPWYGYDLPAEDSRAAGAEDTIDTGTTGEEA
jgi:GTP-binding protein